VQSPSPPTPLPRSGGEGGQTGPPLADAVPKITDFGLAKRLDEDHGQTQSGAILGTPGYMAPEQAAGKAREVGPAADVYGLGAVLYALLTGRPPFHGDSMLATLEQVRSREPAAPRSVQREVPRDLETICLKCLEKAPEKRYATAQDLADDLRRFLDDEPVRARPVGEWERLRRWAWRNPGRAALLAAVAVLLLTITAVSVLAYHTVREKNRRIGEERQAAVEARELADRRADQARRALDFFTNKVQGRLGDALYAVTTRQAIVELAIEQMERLAADPGGDDDGLMSRGLVAAYVQLGDLRWSQQRFPEAAVAFGKARERARQLHVDNPASDKAAGNYALTLVRQAQVAGQENRPDDRRRLLEQARDLQQAIVERPRGDEIPPHEALLSLAGTLDLLGQFDDALRLREKSVGLRATDNGRIDLARSYFALAGRTGDAGARKALYEKCLALYAAAAKDNPGRLPLKTDMAVVLAQIGDIELADDPKAALAHYERHVRLYRELAKTDEIATMRRRLSQAYYRQATAELHAGDREASERDSPGGLYGFALALLHAHYRAASERDFRVCLRLREELNQDYPTNLGVGIELMLARARCGLIREAVESADNLQKHPTLGKNAGMLFQAACAFALCSAAVAPGRTDGELSDPERRQREELRTRALAMIDRAIQAGYKDRAALEKDPDLAPIRALPAFRELLARLPP
jgi:tetratricopeptide (TPR) repeat protein